MKAFCSALRKPLCIAVALLMICGIAYPALLTGLGQLLFPAQANGSMIRVDGQAVGSRLIGQDFTDPRFLKCRPSAVAYNTYDEGLEHAVASGGSNYAPSNPALAERTGAAIDAFLAAHPTVRREDIPADLVTASGSGLDPHISPAAAAVQIDALAQATGLTRERLEAIVAAHTRHKLLGLFGEDAVNVLEVNLDIAQELGMLPR